MLSPCQVNARKIYDEPNALSGILDNKLFVAILAGEVVLQARTSSVQVLMWDFWSVTVGLVPT